MTAHRDEAPADGAARGFREQTENEHRDSNRVCEQTVVLHDALRRG